LLLNAPDMFILTYFIVYLFIECHKKCLEKDNVVCKTPTLAHPQFGPPLQDILKFACLDPKMSDAMYNGLRNNLRNIMS